MNQQEAQAARNAIRLRNPGIRVDDDIPDIISIPYYRTFNPVTNVVEEIDVHTPEVDAAPIRETIDTSVQIPDLALLTIKEGDETTVGEKNVVAEEDLETDDNPLDTVLYFIEENLEDAEKIKLVKDLLIDEDIKRSIAEWILTGGAKCFGTVKKSNKDTCVYGIDDPTYVTDSYKLVTHSAMSPNMKIKVAHAKLVYESPGTHDT
jgi:hypothetical protein